MRNRGCVKSGGRSVAGDRSLSVLPQSSDVVGALPLSHSPRPPQSRGVGVAWKDALAPPLNDGGLVSVSALRPLFDMGGKVSVPRKIRIGRRKKKDEKTATGDSDAPTAVIGEEGEAAPAGEKVSNAENKNGVEAKEAPDTTVDEKQDKPEVESAADKPEVESAAEKPPETVDSGDAAAKVGVKPGDVVVTEVVEVQAVQSTIDGQPVDQRTDAAKATPPAGETADVPPEASTSAVADKPADVPLEPSTSAVDKSTEVPLEKSTSAVDKSEPSTSAVDKSEPSTSAVDQGVVVDQSEEPAKVEETDIAPMSEVVVETTPTTSPIDEPAADKSADKTEPSAAVKPDEVKPADKPSQPAAKPTEPAVAAAASAAEVVATAAVVEKPTEAPTSAAEPPTSSAQPPSDQKPEVVELTPKEKLEELVPFDFEKFPFDNVVFQGAVRGRTLGNVGAVRVLEEAGIWRRVKRIAGTSAGAMTAALVAVGYDSYQLEKFFAADIRDIMADHKFGLISLLPNLIKSYGWNPGHRLYNWFGEKMKERTGNPDITFQEVYTKFGHELCIVTTNLNQMMAEYCHPKTTPDMPVRLAVRMSAAIPVYFKPVSYKRNGKTELFVDGGLLCNYPIHCYDGWWLSMKPEDEFLKRMQPLSSRTHLVLDDNDRFGKYNATTIGFLLYADHEREVFQTLLDERVETDEGEPIIPDTKLSRSHKERCKNSDELSGQHMKLAAAADRFLQALQKQGLDTKEKITKKDLEDVFSKENMPEEDLKVLFGEKISADDIFEKLEDKKGEGFDYGRIAAYLGQRGLDLQAGYMAEFKSMNIGNLKDFLLSLKETMVANTQRLLVKKEDIERTVGINTRYIGTLDFNLEQADRDFLIEQGRRSTVAFLRQYAERHLQDYKLEPPKPFCRDELRRFIDDDLSEIIDPGDYSEKAPDKEFDK